MNDLSSRSHGLWDLAVLTLLYERTMHPYEMQKVLRARHKVEVLGLKRGSLYHAISRLERDGFIVKKDTERDGRRPERTTYQLSNTGSAELFSRLKSHLATIKQEPSEFLACLSFLVYLSPEAAITELETRVARIDTEVQLLGTTVSQVLPYAGRVNLLELEFAKAMLEAERVWVINLVGDIRSGLLTWNIEEILTYLRANSSNNGESM